MEPIIISRNSKGQLIVFCKDISFAQLLIAQENFLKNERLNKTLTD